MKRVLLCLLGIFLVIIEGSITNYLKIFNVSFNIVLIYMVIISLYLDELEAGIIGAIVGITKDIALGGILGVNGLILFAASYVISHIRDKIYKDSSTTIFALVFLTTLADSIVNILATAVVYNSYGIVRLLSTGILAVPIMNSLLSIVLYKISKKYILKLKED